MASNRKAITLDADLHQKLADIANDKRRRISGQLDVAVEFYIECYEAEEEAEGGPDDETE